MKTTQYAKLTFRDPSNWFCHVLISIPKMSNSKTTPDIKGLVYLWLGSCWLNKILIYNYISHCRMYTQIYIFYDMSGHQSQRQVS